MFDIELIRNWDKLPEGEREKTSKALNQAYVQRADEPGGMQRLSSLHQNQLINYLRESSVMDKVLPPSPVSPDQCEVGPTNDTLFKRIWGQFETRAFQGSFEALPTETQEVYVSRIFLGFTMLTSPKYVVNDYNMLAYPFPLAKQVEDQIGLDMHEAKDWVMLDRLEAAIQASRAEYGNVVRGEFAAAEIAGGSLNTGNRFKVTREDFVAIKTYFADRRSRVDRVIIPEVNYLQFETLDLQDFGDDMTADVFRNGLTADKIHGVALIRTIKTDTSKGDVFRTGNIYGFATPGEIGYNYDLRGLKFYLERDHQFLSFDAQLAFGFIWANPARCMKLETYNGGRSTAGVLLPPISALPFIPASDALFGSPQEVTRKDYIQFDKEYFRPNIRYS